MKGSTQDRKISTMKIKRQSYLLHAISVVCVFAHDIVDLNRIHKLQSLSIERNQQSLNSVLPSQRPYMQPSIQPSTQSSVQPSIKPNLLSFNPSAPSASIELSPSPSIALSQLPSQYPSINPIVSPTFTPSTFIRPSHVPSVSPSEFSQQPSSALSSTPSYTLKYDTIQNLEMVIQNISTELESSIAQDDWRNITSTHVLQFWKQSEIDIVKIKTFIVRQDIIERRKSIRLNKRKAQTLYEDGNKTSKSGALSVLKIIFFQEVTLRNASFPIPPAALSLDPFSIDNDIQDYIDTLRMTNDIFATISDLDVRVVNTHMPSFAPSSEPTNLKITETPSSFPTGNNNNSPNPAVVALSSILVCLIVLMIGTSVWFMFIHKRDGSLCHWRDFCIKKTNNDSERLDVVPQSQEVGHPFPIKSESLHNDEDTNVKDVNTEENDRMDRNQEAHSIGSNLISEESSGHSRASYHYADESTLTTSLVLEDQAQE